MNKQNIISQVYTVFLKSGAYIFEKNNMNHMKKWLYALLLLIAFGCKETKIDLSGDVPLKQKDFFGIFKQVRLPYLVSDTNMGKSADTVTIGVKAFLQFFPDSAFNSITGKNRKFSIHPIGKIEKENEIYCLILITQQKQKILAVFVTDKKYQYLASKELLSNNNKDEYIHSLSINKEPTFLISKEKMGKDNNLLFSRAGWVYNDAGIFMVVINDSNEDPIKSAVINPIDTLSKKNKLSGDYIKDKKNYVSIRDGKDANNFRFFIHFERNEGSCTGELKGELNITKPNTGIFRENGDPCIIDFLFEGNRITIKEQGSCGNHRGIKCFFNDEFIKKKEPKIKNSTKKR